MIITKREKNHRCPTADCSHKRSSTLPLRLLPITLAVLFLLTGPVPSAMAENTAVPTQWALLTGYGTSHPGWGETETRVETIDLALRRSSVMIDDIGSSWYRGFHSLFIEIPFHFLVEPNDTPMIGVNFLASYTFTGFALQPYLFGGGGPVYIDADIDGMGSSWNGNYQFGAGVRYHLDNHHSLLFECRYHHISNGNTSEPNLPLNSTKFLIGYTF